MSDFRAYCDDLLVRARGAGWEVITEKAIPYGRQYHLSQPGSENAVLSCYHGKKGFKFVPGGKAADALVATLGGAAPMRAGGTAAAGAGDPFELGTPRIGADESGKGDYFGPLVTAAYRLDDGGLAQLRALGVTDSKALADSRIERIAGELEATGHGEVEVLMPRDYNPRYAEIGNINTLLSLMHGACIRRLHERTGTPGAVIVDQYARNTVILEREAHLPSGTRFATRTKGEADPAVAAASILARAGFVRGLRELSHEFGMTLPPGAGSPVLRGGSTFIRTFGREALADVAKLHFATSSKI